MTDNKPSPPNLTPNSCEGVAGDRRVDTLQERVTGNGIELSFTDNGVSRVMQLWRGTLGNFRITMRTEWPEGEPVVTTVPLTPTGLHMLLELIGSAHLLDQNATEPRPKA